MKKTLILLSTILLISCGSRKSTTQTEKVNLKTETQTEFKENENTKITIDTEINKETNEVTEIETIEPIDATKPSFYSGREFKNTKITKRKTNVLSKDKSKVNQVVKNDKKVVKNERVKAKAVVKTKSKQTERKTSILDYWWLLLLLLFVYVGWKKRKELFL